MTVMSSGVATAAPVEPIENAKEILKKLRRAISFSFIPQKENAMASLHK